MTELPVPRRGGQRAGADELWGSTEYAAPVSIRNFIPESLLIAWAKLAGDAEASELTAPRPICFLSTRRWRYPRRSRPCCRTSDVHI